ncbi:TonB-dependent receptor [Flavobacterium branchiophilum]|uniref:Probable TonB-dependent outer membrane receptor n=1 Tax=Flavobacterium branchiophilum (strain FL-15) TaxID=1034807 RepID=G2Z6J9_FLABF|nr:TonB-dependent receptor [Flavobacterium branchiophilum]CCB68358.1 Probable TonB-dependent outer membrane receptor precursor [Flavobacterium branchiophilum FL-15]
MYKKTCRLLLICWITALNGQEQPIIMEEVIIKARKKTNKENKEFEKHAQSIESLSEYELNRNNPNFIEQSLNTVAGIQVDKRTAIGGQRIVIRGYGNDQKFNNWGIKMYYNNMPLTNADGITILDDIDFSFVHAIDVVKGPAATLYGGGIGGVVRFYSKTQNENGHSIEQRTGFGTNNLFQSNLIFNYNTNQTKMCLSYNHLETNGYRPHGASLKNFITYLGDFKISDSEKMNIYASHNFSFEQVAGQISYSDYYQGIDNGNSAYIKKNAGNKLKSLRFGISYDNQVSKTIKNSTTFFYYNSDFERIAAGAFEISKNTNYGIRSQFTFKKNINEKWHYSNELGTEIHVTTSLISNYRFLGTDDNNPWLVSDITKASYFNYQNQQISFFTNNRLEYQPLKLTFIVGLSTNNVKFKRTDLLAIPGLINNYNKDLSLTKSFGWKLNPHLAFQKKIKNHIFNLSLSYGYNAPTASTAFISGLNQTNDLLQAEQAKMFDFSIHGLFLDTKLDYQLAFYNIQIKNKLTQLSGVNPIGGTAYQYWTNTGNQTNKGIELSMGYIFETQFSKVIQSIQPFFSFNYNDFKYKNFNTKFGNSIVDYTNKIVVGTPDYKFSIGFDFNLIKNLYVNTTYSQMGRVYTDFENANLVHGFEQFNMKIGYKKNFFNSKCLLDFYIAGNNLTNKINYNFLFLGNNINDNDVGNNYPTGVATDVNPGPSKSYFFGSLNLKYYL